METQAGFFRSVQPLPQHKLEVVMETDTHIVFDFTSRLGTMRFGALVDDDLFNSVRTDGNCILFGKPGAAETGRTAAMNASSGMRSESAVMMEMDVQPVRKLPPVGGRRSWTVILAASESPRAALKGLVEKRAGL